MKALPLAAILRIMKDQNVHIDACSDYEAHRAIAAGIPADHIQITGQIWPETLPVLIEQ